jgi:rare lipoprotein A (peptidoglycan hydrolase)
MIMTGGRHPEFIGLLSAESYTRKILACTTWPMIAYTCNGRSGPIVAVGQSPRFAAPNKNAQNTLLFVHCRSLTSFGLFSFYANKFAGKTMADSTSVRPRGDNAASTTLPLGTTALVTNLETGRSAKVTIRDRGKLQGSESVAADLIRKRQAEDCGACA